MERIYYDSKTGNVERFIAKIQALTGWDIRKIDVGTPIYERGHLVTFTTRFGEIPDSTKQFIIQAAPYLDSVSSSGNRNWGKNFAVAADMVSAQYGIPVALKFELSGTPEDVQQFINLVVEKNYGQKRNRQELDPAQ